MQELIGALVKQLGINEQQAAGGAGLLFKFAKELTTLVASALLRQGSRIL